LVFSQSFSQKKPSTLIWCITKPDDERLSQAITLLTADDQQRATRFKNPLHGQWWAYVRRAMLDILSLQLGCEKQDIAFSYTKTNKPFFSDKKYKNIHFNLSHCTGGALLVISDYAEVGIDIERIKRISDAESVAKHFFSTTEQNYLLQSRSGNRIGAPNELTHNTSDELFHETFYEIWTQKEALIKANGGGLSLPLDAFDVQKVNPKQWTTIKPKTKDFANNSYQIKQLLLDDVGLGLTHRAALCFALPKSLALDTESEQKTPPDVTLKKYFPS
jgi:4'-phosphopantetheinyl transferase